MFDTYSYERGDLLSWIQATWERFFVEFNEVHLHSETCAKAWMSRTPAFSIYRTFFRYQFSYTFLLNLLVSVKLLNRRICELYSSFASSCTWDDLTYFKYADFENWCYKKWFGSHMIENSAPSWQPH